MAVCWQCYEGKRDYRALGRASTPGCMVKDPQLTVTGVNGEVIFKGKYWMVGGFKI